MNMVYSKHARSILVLWLYQSLLSYVWTQQLLEPTADPSATYYTTFMLCSQTPSIYRTKGCVIDQNCKVPRLTKCIGGICCARDSVALDALSMAEALFSEPPLKESVNTFVQKTRKNQGQSKTWEPKPVTLQPPPIVPVFSQKQEPSTSINVPKPRTVSRPRVNENSIPKHSIIMETIKLSQMWNKRDKTRKHNPSQPKWKTQPLQTSSAHSTDNIITSERSVKVQSLSISPAKQTLPSLSRKENLEPKLDITQNEVTEVTSPVVADTTPVPRYSSAASCEDVSIIGAGIAGTYAAWRLRNMGMKIGIYEYTDRVGGRLFTYHFREAPDLNIELGAMRYLPNAHKRMDKAAKDLRLPIKEFEEGLGKKDRTMFYLREVHLGPNDLGGIHTPYNLRPAEMKSPEKLRWYLSSTYTNFTGDFSNINQDLFTIHTADGVALYQQSHAEAFAKMASQEAMRYLRDHLGFHGGFGSASAAMHIPAVRPPDPEAPEPIVKTIATGMDSFPRTFQHEFLSTSDLHTLHRNQKLYSIHAREAGGYTLNFRKTRTSNGETMEIKRSKIQVCSNKVILAIPKVPLQQIEWESLQDKHIQENLDSVTDNPAASVFLLYDRPWWRDVGLNFTHVKTDLPNRQIYDFGVSRNTGKAVLMVCLLDGDEVKYWRKLQKHGKKLGWRSDVNAVTDYVVTNAHIHLSYIYNVSMYDIPPARDGSIMLWDEYPFNGAWGLWKPGYKWMNVRREITKPSENDEIYISPGYYGTFSNNYWAEGALEGMDEVLKQFGLPPYT